VRQPLETIIVNSPKIAMYCKKRSAKKYSHSSLPTGVLQ